MDTVVLSIMNEPALICDSVDEALSQLRDWATKWGYSDNTIFVSFDTGEVRFETCQEPFAKIIGVFS